MLWAMRIFLAGASGVLGMRLVPLLVGAGHEVWGMTRSPDKVERLAALGAVPVICDVFEAAALREAVVAARPDTVMHQLTDLPDKAGLDPELRCRERSHPPRGDPQPAGGRPCRRGQAVARPECRLGAGR